MQHLQHVLWVPILQDVLDRALGAEGPWFGVGGLGGGWPLFIFVVLCREF